MRSLLINFLTISLLIGVSCDKPSDKLKKEENGKDRELMLMHYADSIIIPSYVEFKSDFLVLKNNISLFTANPEQNNLNALRQAWVNAYMSWQSVELFEFGPADQVTLRNFYNIYPADSNGIKNNIGNTAANLEIPASYPQQGFPALDFLINGVALDDAGIVAFYKDPVNGNARTTYLNRLSNRMSDLLNQVLNAWQTDYRNTFVLKTGLDLNASSSLMVNGLVLHYERFIRSGKVGIPSGVMQNGVIAPDKVEAFYKKDISKALLEASHQAYFNFFKGLSYYSKIQGPSLKTYLDALNARESSGGRLLTELIDEAFINVETKLSTLNPNFIEQITADTQPMKETYEAMQTVVRMLKVDMSSAMSITITYTDNDGD